MPTKTAQLKIELKGARSIADVEKNIKNINKELKNTKKGTSSFKELEKVSAQANTKLKNTTKELKNVGKNGEKSIGKMSDGFKEFGNQIPGVSGGLGKLSGVLTGALNPATLAFAAVLGTVALAFQDLTSYTQSWEGSLSDAGVELASLQLGLDTFWTKLGEERGKALAEEGIGGFITTATGQVIDLVDWANSFGTAVNESTIKLREQLVISKEVVKLQNNWNKGRLESITLEAGLVEEQEKQLKTIKSLVDEATGLRISDEERLEAIENFKTATNALANIQIKNTKNEIIFLKEQSKLTENNLEDNIKIEEKKAQIFRINAKRNKELVKTVGFERKIETSAKKTADAKAKQLEADIKIAEQKKIAEEKAAEAAAEAKLKAIISERDQDLRIKQLGEEFVIRTLINEIQEDGGLALLGGIRLSEEEAEAKQKTLLLEVEINKLKTQRNNLDDDNLKGVITDKDLREKRLILDLKILNANVKLNKANENLSSLIERRIVAMEEYVNLQNEATEGVSEERLLRQANLDANIKHAELVESSFIPLLREANQLVTDEKEEWLLNADAIELLDERLRKVALVTSIIGDAASLGFDAMFIGLENNLIDLDKRLADIRKEQEDFNENEIDFQALLKDANGEKFAAIEKEMEAQDNLRDELHKKEVDARNAIIDGENKQAKIQKQQAIVDSIIQTTLAVVSALPNIPLSIVAGVLGAAGTATIIGKKIPLQEHVEYAEGGYTGDGNVKEVAGLVHKKEYVIPEPVLATSIGTDMAVMLEAMRTGMKGFADGGFTSNVPTPSTPVATNVNQLTREPQFVSVVEIRDVGRNINVIESKSSL